MASPTFDLFPTIKKGYVLKKTDQNQYFLMQNLEWTQIQVKMQISGISNVFVKNLCHFHS